MAQPFTPHNDDERRRGENRPPNAGRKKEGRNHLGRLGREEI